jgi:hypothetical protein
MKPEMQHKPVTETMAAAKKKMRMIHPIPITLVISRQQMIQN